VQSLERRGPETALEAGRDARGQRKRDKAAFWGLFDRGVIYDYTRNNGETTTTTTATLGKPRNDNDERDVILGRRLAQLYEERGMHNEKERIEQSLKQYENRINMDIRNPTRSMIADAKSVGVDLTDPTTIALLEKLRDDATSLSNEERLIMDAKSNGKSMIRPRAGVLQFVLIIILVIRIVWVLLVTK
jgi:hypothetical protein